MREMLEMVMKNQLHPLGNGMQIEDMTVQELMVAKWAAEAIKDWKAAQAYREALEGKPIQKNHNLNAPTEARMFEVVSDPNEVTPNGAG
jgi:hypothetical protein